MVKTIYSKKIKDNLDEYRYYIKRYKNGKVFVIVEAASYNPTNRYFEKQCLEISEKEVEEIIRLLNEDPELFEEEYGGRNGWIDC
jgi:flavorubredoxin